MSLQGITDIFAALSSAIGPGAPVTFGKKASPTNTAPPIYVAYPVDHRFGGAQTGGASTTPRTLATKIVDCEIQCWGVTYLQCEQLEQTMITAIRQVMSGANVELQSSEWRDSANMELGQVLVMRVGFVTALVQAQLPFPGIPAGTDQNTGTVVVTAEAPDTTGLTPGTGVMYRGEPS